MNSPSITPPRAKTYRRKRHQELLLQMIESAEPELVDLIFSWRRVYDPNMRRIALELIRSMASSPDKS